MLYERAVGLIVRTYDWSETSRIVVVWTREFGKVRLLAKGGRRLKSSFEVALDLLTACSIVWLRKPSHGGLEILTEARIEEQFPILRKNLKALNVGYYIAELLGEGTQDYDPHPALYDATLTALRLLAEEVNGSAAVAFWFEWIWLCESGHRPVTETCVNCARNPAEWENGESSAFSASGGGLVCPNCRSGYRDRFDIEVGTRLFIAGLDVFDAGRWKALAAISRRQVRRILCDSVVYHLGKKPRLMVFPG